MNQNKTFFRASGWLVALAMGAWAAPAQAVDWADVFPGVGYSQWTVGGPNRVSAVRVDLCHAGVSLRATKHAERAQTPSAFGTAVGADVAINADFFDGSYNTTNLAIGDGERWPNSVDREDREFIAFGAGRVMLSKDWQTVTDYGWMDDAVGGAFTVLDNNTIPALGSAHCTARHPRTFVGFSEDERILYMAVVDGRSGSSVGMTCTELGTVMKDMGAWNAISLDGGGSSALWMRGHGVMNHPSDGSQRVVANHLAVRARGTGAPEACNDLGSSFKVVVRADDFNPQGASQGVPDVLVGDEFEADLIFKDVGAIVLPGVQVDYAFGTPYLLPIHYAIESDHPAYDQQTWTVNSADTNAANPAKDALGARGTLAMDAFSPQESKRIKVTFRAEEYNIGKLEHPNIRAWLRHIADLYGEQTEWDQAPTNANLFGELIQDQMQVDVLSPREWQFNGGEGQLEGWAPCDGTESALTTDPTHTAMLAEGAQAAHCAESPAWTSVDSATFDQMVIRARAEGAGGNLRLGWKSAAQPFDDAHAVGFRPELGPEIQTYVLDLAQIAEWRETIEGLRLSWAPGAFERVAIDAIFFQDSAAQATSSATEAFVAQPAVEFRDELEPDDENPGEPDTGQELDAASPDAGDGPVQNNEADGSVAIGGECGCSAGATGRPMIPGAPIAALVLVIGWGVRRRRR